MLHVTVAFALIAAGAADLEARLELGAQGRRIAVTRPRDQRGGHLADVGTVEIQANAAHQALHILFSQTRIRTHGARLRAFGTRLDARAGLIAIGSCRVWMRTHHALE